MRRRTLLTGFILLVLAAGVSTALEFSDIYVRIGENSSDRAVNAGLYIFPTLVIPMGGEFEGMGQAYTAVSRDASFFDANAAGSATLEFTELTFVHNNWIADTSLEGVLYTRRFSDLGAQQNDLGVAVGGKFLHVPFTQIDSISRQVASGRYSEGTVGVNVSYNFLSSYAFPGVAVGATIKSAYRLVPERIAPGQSALGVAADLGLMTRFDLLKTYASRSPNFAVGLAARNFGPPVRSEPLPSQLSAGLAYAPLRPLTIAIDVILPVSLASGVPSPPLAGATGISVDITPFFSAQAGMLLRWGGSRFSMGATLELTDVSIDVNYNLDLATQFTNLDRFSVQARLNFGDEGRAALRDLVDQYYLEAWQAQALGDYEIAIEYSGRALELDRDFLPAQELLASATNLLELQEGLGSIEIDTILDPVAPPADE